MPRVAAYVNYADNTWLFDQKRGVDNTVVPAAIPLISLIEEITLPTPEMRLRSGDEHLVVSHAATEQEIHAAFQ